MPPPSFPPLQIGSIPTIPPNVKDYVKIGIERLLLSQILILVVFLAITSCSKAYCKQDL